MRTSPMTFADAESCLRLTVAALSNVLDARDQQFLEQAMRSYGALCLAATIRDIRERGFAGSLNQISS